MFPMSRKDIKEAYRCGAYHQRGLKGCTSHHIRVDILDSVIKAYLQNVRDTSAEMIEKLQRSIKGEADALKNNIEVVTVLENQLADAKDERKMLIRQKTREIMRHPEREESIEETYDELLAECDVRIEGIENQIILTQKKQSTVIRVNRIAKLAIDIFSEILDKDHLDKHDLELLIEKIYVYEDHIHIKLKDDIECILKSGILPDMDDVANFKEGIIDSLSTVIVQSSRNQKDKVYDVSVISSGDPLEIYTDGGGEVIFKKYSPIGEIGEFATQYADSLYKTCGFSVIISDRESVIACAGLPKKDFLKKQLSKELEDILENRTLYTTDGGHEVEVTDGGTDGYYISCTMPIISEGDITGCVAAVTSKDADKKHTVGDTEQKLIQTAASFLGKQLEQ